MDATEQSTLRAGFRPGLVDTIPRGEERSGRYAVGFARTPRALDAVLRLRYEVFNLELEEGLEQSHQTGRDFDLFDPGCHHLLVREVGAGEVVGTYRMQTRAMAEAWQGFYSDGEFELSSLPDSVLNRSVELGRACVAREHRNGRVLFLMWRGICRYLADLDQRYFFGCCSLTSQDPVEAWAVYERLRIDGHVHSALHAEPRTDYCCPRPTGTVGAAGAVKIPKLMRLYLEYGARICSPPAIDRAFKTIDYLALFDREEAPPSVCRLFFS